MYMHVIDCLQTRIVFLFTTDNSLSTFNFTLVHKHTYAWLAVA